MARRRGEIEASFARYLQQLDTADRQELSARSRSKTTRLRDKIAKLGDEMRRLADIEARLLESPDQQVSLPIPMRAPWRRAGAAPAWSATTCRSPSTPSII